VVEIKVLALGSELAEDLGAVADPTVAVGDLVIAVGQVPPAGTWLRAIETLRSATDERVEYVEIRAQEFEDSGCER